MRVRGVAQTNTGAAGEVFGFGFWPCVGAELQAAAIPDVGTGKTKEGGQDRGRRKKKKKMKRIETARIRSVVLSLANS